MIQRYREIKRSRENGEIRDYGFTLIELLIVIVVLGILAAIVIFSLTGVTGQSAQAACVSDAKTVQIAIAAYQAENAGFPATSGDLLSTTAIGGPFLHSYPSNAPHYGIIMNGSGTVFIGVGTATTGPAFDSEVNSTPGPATGCFAVK